MNKTSIFILTLIAFMLIAYYLYFNVFELIYNKKIHPLIDQYKKDFNKKRKKRIWEKLISD